MFCNQCEQAKDVIGCSGSLGKCGKNEDVQSLQEILLYGLKGLAAYAHHARRLGQSDEKVSAFIEDALFSTLTNVNFDIDSLFELCMECGRQNLRVMQLLDEGHVKAFGKPAPGAVEVGTHAGPGILVTGHDLVDLWNLLKQCEGTAVKVYTHGEMLPGHMYPKLKNHPNMGGHFGGAWQLQKTDFARFNGPVLATTNCIMPPLASYAGRVFSTRVTAWPNGNPPIKNDDFSQIIKLALESKPLEERITGELTVGFHHSVLLDNAATIVDAVKAGQISRFFVIGGCDGSESARSYYTDFALATPKDSFILTLGCGKFRINGHDHGTHLGFPRLMDMGQCNDAYGAIQVAVGLAQAFNCGVNDLPLTLVISWFEQKAVAVLLTLLALDVKGIRIGPNPPAFVTPNVFKILQEKFDLQLIGEDAQADLELVMA